MSDEMKARIFLLASAAATTALTVYAIAAPLHNPNGAH